MISLSVIMMVDGIVIMTIYASENNDGRLSNNGGDSSENY